MLNKVIQFTALILIFLCISSCKQLRHGIDVTVTNVTSNTIYNITVEAGTDALIEIDSLLSNTTVTKYLDMRQLPKIDGSYMVTFMLPHGEQFKEPYGYFTNGYPVNYELCLTIGDPTIFVTFDDFCE